jgi:hypothetical protein
VFARRQREPREHLRDVPSHFWLFDLRDALNQAFLVRALKFGALRGNFFDGIGAKHPQNRVRVQHSG